MTYFIEVLRMVAITVIILGAMDMCNVAVKRSEDFKLKLKQMECKE